MLMLKRLSPLISYQEEPNQECEAVVQHSGDVTELAWKFLRPEPDYYCHLYFKVDGFILSLGMQGGFVDHL